MWQNHCNSTGLYACVCVCTHMTIMLYTCDVTYLLIVDHCNSTGLCVFVYVSVNMYICTFVLMHSNIIVCLPVNICCMYNVRALTSIHSHNIIELLVGDEYLA